MFNKDGTYLFEEVVEAGVNFLRDRIKRRPPYRFHVERWRRMIQRATCEVYLEMTVSFEVSEGWIKVVSTDGVLLNWDELP